MANILDNFQGVRISKSLNFKKHQSNPLRNLPQRIVKICQTTLPPKSLEIALAIDFHSPQNEK